MKLESQPESGKSKCKNTSKKAAETPKRRRWDSRLSLPRTMDIFERLQDGKPVNCTIMAELLEVSPKVIKGDISKMQNEMKLPIDFDFKKNTYYFYEPVDHFPALPLTARELFVISIIHPAREMYKGTSFGKAVESSFRKLLGRLDDEQKYIVENLDAEISFRPVGPEEVDIELIEKLRGAVHDRKVVEFPYMKPDADEFELRTGDPYHVMLCDGAWYLFTWDHRAKDIRKFRLSRMGAVKVLKQKFTFPKDFSVKKLLAKCFGMMSGKGDHRVVIDLSRWATRIIGMRRLNAMTKREMLPDGGSRLTFQLDCLEEIERWVLYWAEHATVRENEELKERICRSTLKMLAKYDVAVPPSIVSPEFTAPSQAIAA